MAHKTFISYKYSDAQNLRDEIIDKLRENASFYKGETSESPDLTDTSTDNIKKNLSDMMYDTSVTIVIISPNMKQSKWIDWELEYCLKNNTRKERTSHVNGILGVIMKVNNSYNWIKSVHRNEDGCFLTSYDSSKTYKIINDNRFNQNPMKYECKVCRTVNGLTGSYISFVTEDDFLANPNKYIDNAYAKSENDASGYILTKTR